MNESPKGAADRELLTFQVDAQEFCVDVATVREIRGWTPATPLPHAPEYVRGIVNLRGAVLPIIDLAARLGFAATKTTDRSVIIVTEVGSEVTGLLVDGVSDIMSITGDMMQSTPEVASGQTQTIVEGIVTVEGRMISVLSLENALPRSEAAAAA